MSGFPATTSTKPACVATGIRMIVAPFGAMGLIIRLLITAFSLWLATVLIDGIELTTDSVSEQIITLLIVAVIFGVINAVLRPIIKVVGCGLYVLTLGLIALIVNGALFLLTSWVADQFDLPFHVDNFWPSAVLGALLVGVVSWLLNMLVPDSND